MNKVNYFHKRWFSPTGKIVVTRAGGGGDIDKGSVRTGAPRRGQWARTSHNANEEEKE